MEEKTPYHQLLEKELSRGEFIATLGFGLVSLMGFSSIIKFLTGKSSKHFASQNKGYGSSPYGK